MKTDLAWALTLLVGGIVGLPVCAQDKAKQGTWQVKDSGVKDDLHAVAFATDNVGVAVGANYTILRTVDGGKTWQRVMGPKKQGGASFAAVLFVNDKVGWVRNEFTTDVYRTADAGATWTHVKTPKEGDIFAPNGFATHAAVGDTYFWQNSFAQVGGNRLYKTTGAGGRWTTLWTSDGTLGGVGAAIAFPTAQEGWMASLSKNVPPRFFVGRSSDGGKTWKKQEITEKVKGTAMRIQAIDKDHGWVASNLSNFVHASTDGGKSWTAYPLQNGDDSSVRLHFASAKVGHVLCGSNNWHVRQTFDGGRSWQSLGRLGRSGTEKEAVHGLFFSSDRHGWIVGAKGYIGHFAKE